MKYLQAYLLAKSRGKENPKINDIRDTLESIGIEFDHGKAEYTIKQYNGKNINEHFHNDEIQRMTNELLDEIRRHESQVPLNGDNSQHQDKIFGLTMTLRLTEDGPLEKYALTLIDNYDFLNSAGKKIDLRKEDISNNVNQLWHFGHGELNTVINPVMHNDIVWDVADRYNLNPSERTPFYIFPFHGRHNQHFIYKNNMIYARQNGHVVTYVGGDIPFVMMPPKEELRERQTINITVQKDILFQYNSSNPFNGIINYLNKTTNGNVQTNNTIQITSSDLWCGNYEALVDYKNESGHAHVHGEPMWLQFDFKNKRFQINSYLIKSAHSDSNSHCSYYLKNWKIEISLDGNQWNQIDERSNDSALNGNYKMHLYHLNTISPPFRFIRIVSNGGNWNDEDFTIGKFEIFGNIIELK